MNFSEDYHRLNAVYSALEWLLLRLAKSSANPQSVLDDFARHMETCSKELEVFGLEMVKQGKMDTFSNSIDARSALDELKTSMLENLKVG